MGTNYAAGRRFEWATRKEYEALGYLVMRTAGSKSPYDLIAMKWPEIILIQCKYGAKPTVPKNHPDPTGGWTTRYVLVWKPRGGQAENLVG